jgi:hypothetical protein
MFLIRLAVVLPIALASPLTVQAKTRSESPTLKIHVIKFYLDPALAPDVEFAKSVLPKYVADMNTILAKNTLRRLVFDPQTGLILTDKKPHTDSARSPLPTEGFEIWVHAVQTGAPISYGGYAGIDASGAGVLGGLKWTHLYDPDRLTLAEVMDYTIQLDHMLHELAHVFGAGMGEYYNLAHINDTTNTAPLLNINLNDPADSFWGDKPDFMTDPLLRFTRTSSRPDYLSTVRYSDLTAAILNGGYRNGFPSFTQTTLQVLDTKGQPVMGVSVKIWSVLGIAPYTNQLVLDGTTDEWGKIIFSWGDSMSSHNAGNFLRLIKVVRNDPAEVQARYVSIFDADIAELVRQDEAHVVTITLVSNQTASDPSPAMGYSMYLPLVVKSTP